MERPINGTGSLTVFRDFRVRNPFREAWKLNYTILLIRLKVTPSEKVKLNYRGSLTGLSTETDVSFAVIHIKQKPPSTGSSPQNWGRRGAPGARSRIGGGAERPEGTRMMAFLASVGRPFIRRVLSVPESVMQYPNLLCCVTLVTRILWSSLHRFLYCSI